MTRMGAVLLLLVLAVSTVGGVVGTFVPPVDVYDVAAKDVGQIAQMEDVNADGLVDFVMSYFIAEDNQDEQVYLNNGVAWVEGAEWNGIHPDAWTRLTVSVCQGDNPEVVLVGRWQSDTVVSAAVAAALQLSQSSVTGLRHANGTVFPVSASVPSGTYTVAAESSLGCPGVGAVLPQGSLREKGSRTTDGPLASWTVEDVCAWAETKLGLETKEVRLLRQERIRGAALPLLTARDLIEIGFRRGPALEFAAAAKRVRSVSQATFPSAPTTCTVLEYNYPVPGSSSGAFQVIDVNGDRLPDLVQFGNASDNRGPEVCVWINPGL